MKVEQEADFEFGKFEIGEQLGFVNGEGLFDCFDFDDYLRSTTMSIL